MSFSRLVWFALRGAGLLTFVSCDRGSPPSTSREARPADRQELVVASGEDEFGLELNRHRLGMYPLNAMICETLVRLTHDFQVEPWLATRWSFRGDNTYRFTLRPGVKFSDGRRLDAAAVAYTLEHAVRIGTQHSFLDSNSVHVVDDSTIDVRPARPNLRVLQQLVHPSYGIIAPGSDPSVNPVCTGPFRFVEYVKRDHLTVERNDDYWGDKAKLERLTFRFIPDDNTRALALRAGDVDGIFDVHHSMVAGLRRVPGIEIVTAPPGAVMLLYMATRGTPPYGRLADPVIRRAVAMAIDRKALVDHVLDGHGKVVNTVNPPAVLGPYASRVTGVPHEQVGAARLLDRAGWKAGADGIRRKNGDRLMLTLISQPTSVDRAVGEYLQAELAQVGIEVRVELLDPASFQSRLNAGEFDLDIEVPNQNDANPAFLLALRWYSGSDVTSATFMNAGPRFDTLIEQALTGTEHDEVQKKAAEAMHVLVDQEVVAVPLAGLYRIYAMKSRVRGFEPHPSKTNQWWTTVWLAK